MSRRSFIVVLAALALAACHGADDAKAKANLDAGATFLVKNRNAADIHVTKSGLQYRILHSGPATGLRPKPSDEVKVNYEGKLLSGEVFDSSYERGAPIVMRPKELVPGWTEALQLMRPGDIWELYLPPSLGYGEKGAGPIPPNSVLVFKLELIDVLPDPGSVGRG